jgi:F-type H+-transporting ATPase subunit epsilon
MPKHDEPKPLQIIARAPFQLYYEGPATVVSAVNPVGPFDILPGHADFFSVLVPCQVIIEPPEGEPVTFDITTGIVTAQDNDVNLFVNM